MSLSQHLISKLRKRYEPSAFITMRYNGNDLMVKTDGKGNPVTVFIGELNDQGRIKGYRYTRVLKTDSDGNVIKDHWEQKGKT